MKPAIIFHPDEPHRAHLIDKEAPAFLPMGGTGERRTHYQTAIAICGLDAGEFAFDPFQSGSAATKRPRSKEVIRLWLAGMASPRPAVFIPLRRHVEEVPSHRLIDDRAAIVLLKLAESFNNIKTERNRTWEFRDPAIEGEELPWSEWRFITAWLWSEWNARPKKPTLAERFAEVEALGYDRGLKSFEAMHRQMFPKISR